MLQHGFTQTIESDDDVSAMGLGYDIMCMVGGSGQEGVNFCSNPLNQLLEDNFSA